MKPHRVAEAKKDSDYQQRVQWFEVAVSAASDAGWRALMADCTTPVYLWHRRGGLTMAAEKPGAEWELSSGEAQRGSQTRDQMRAWIHNLARRLPCLPLEESEKA